MRKNMLLTGLFLFSLSLTPVFAEESTGSASSSPSARKQQLNDALQARKTAVTEAREAYKARLEAARAEWETKRAALKANLKKVTDERKQKIVENVADRMANRNEYWVKHWTTILNRLTEILDKLETRANEAKANGKDTTGVTAAIVSARTAITMAQTKVTSQAGKVYTPPVTDEARLGKNVSGAISQMKVDVSSVVESINAARRAVQNVFKEIKLVTKDPKPTGTGTATVTPSATPTATPAATASPVPTP